jgi:hypothetical protein
MTMSSHPRRRFTLALVFVALMLLVDHVLISRAAPTQQVLINEFMPNTGNDSVKKEWVELFNPNPDPVNLSGWNNAPPLPRGRTLI